MQLGYSLDRDDHQLSTTVLCVLCVPSFMNVRLLKEDTEQYDCVTNSSNNTMAASMLGIVLAVHCLTVFISLTPTARHPPYDIHTWPFDELITRIHSNDMSSLELVFAVELEPIRCNIFE